MDLPLVHPPLTPQERAAYAAFYEHFWTIAVEAVRYTLDDPDVWEIAVALGVVETVADDEAVFDREAQVVDGHLHARARVG